ncbi:hypothetical protein FIBSPDRAFT_519223 [Athelia psychrophila]|uniref:Uncharacterized protein n=1 Tax=Athelia psychrophila TaxID=1759441 RepID=A0A166JRJ8_9AGAM|nr:hypothetical protein FIBSPDRAFT_519223 [Fibularhizoctonia sp. CBS 109695]
MVVVVVDCKVRSPISGPELRSTSIVAISARCMENDSTFVAPEGVYSVTEEYKPAPSHLHPITPIIPIHPLPPLSHHRSIPRTQGQVLSTTFSNASLVDLLPSFAQFCSTLMVYMVSSGFFELTGPLFPLGGGRPSSNNCTT